MSVCLLRPSCTDLNKIWPIKTPANVIAGTSTSVSIMDILEPRNPDMLRTVCS